MGPFFNLASGTRNSWTGPGHMGKLSDPKVIISFLTSLSNLSKGNRSLTPSKSPCYPPSALRSPSALYPSLMKSLSSSNRPDLSLLLFLTLPSGSLPSPPIFNSFLQSLNLLNQPHLLASSMTSLFSLFNLAPSEVSFTILLNSYPNSLDLAYDALFRIKNLDSVAMGSFIAALCRFGRVNEARGVLDVMLEKGIMPSVETCTCILKAYCVERNVKFAKRFVDLMENGELPKPDVVTYTVYIEGLCLVRDFDSVEQLLKETARDHSTWKPNSITYNAYISGLCRAGMLAEAFHQTGVMRENGLQPTEETLNILFDCLCRDPSTILKASVLLQRSTELNWEVDSIFCNTLMGRLLEINEPIRVLKTLTDMLKKGVKPDTCSFTIFIRALCRAGKYNLAKFIVTRTEIDADIITYNTLLHELYRAGELREVNWLYIHMIERKVLPSKFTCGIMIGCLCREGKFLEAMQFVTNLLEDKILSSTDLVTRLIKWLVIYGRLGLVLHLFDEMSKRGFDLNPVFVDSLIRELCRKGCCKGEEFSQISFLLDYILRLT